MIKLPPVRKCLFAAVLAGGVTATLAAEPLPQKPAPSGLPRLLPPGTVSGGDSFKQLASGTYDYSRVAGPQNHPERSMPGSGAARSGLTRAAEMDPLASTATEPAAAGANAAPQLPGELSSSAVPEAGTYALLLAGLVAIGFAAGRRRPN